MTTLASYTDLISTVLSYLDRDSDGAVIPVATFIETSEKQFNRRLKTHYQETSIAIPTVVSQTIYAIPADCLNIRQITVSGTPWGIREIDYQSPAELDASYRNTHVGTPHIYTTEGQNLRVAPTPDSADYTITIKYFQSLTPLDADHTNWLFDNWADLYLYSALVEAMPFLGEDDMSPRLKAFSDRREQIYAEIAQAEQKYKMSSGPLVLGFKSYNRRHRL